MRGELNPTAGPRGRLRHDAPWGEPAETLLTLAPRHDVRLVMPKLGAPVEPVHVAWWRAVAVLEKGERLSGTAAEPEGEPFTVGEPID